MADINQELNHLRKNIARIIYLHEVWETLRDVCRSLGLPVDENPTGLGKEKYLYKVTSEASESVIISAAQKILIRYPSTRGMASEADLQRIQDSLWFIESKGIQNISSVTRYRIAESLEGSRFWGRLGIRDIFAPTIPTAMEKSFPEIGSDGNLFYDLSSSIFAAVISGSKNLSQVSVSRISVQQFLIGLGFIEWPDKRFCLFLERIVHPEVQPIDRQKQLVAQLNALLQNDGFELQQDNIQGGFPVYKARKKSSGVSGVPKYIIFASIGPKPDIVIDDAVNMDIRIVRFAEKCIVYDQPPTNGDLTWQMLLEWWGKKKSSDPNNSNFRRDFGHRLRASLQSEPERILFDTYFKEFKSRMGDNLPALLPQVYLHYDPRNKVERDKPVLIRQRMDFLLLLRNSARIVIEVDGVQHYSDKGGCASTAKYAEMVSEDRRIRLLGYEIYRFGGSEFIFPNAQQSIIAFFEELFRRHMS